MMLLTTLITVPLAGALILVIMPRRKEIIRSVAFIASLLAFLLSFSLFAYNGSKELFAFTVNFVWLKSLNVSFNFGVDGLSIVLIFLTTLLSLLAVIGSFTVEREREKFYFAMLLLLEAALIGVFSARDFILFYIFWEAVLIPMYFLIGIWGSEEREYAALKFFIYTFAGSALMLIGALIVYVFGNAGSFDFEALAASINNMPLNLKIFTFWLMFIGFAVKLPSFPFHTWLPDAHVQAPTSVSVLLAGVLLKMGGYGIIRMNVTFFPDLMFKYRWYLLIFAVISIVYGALLAFAQNDIKRLVAYSSVAHMGFVTAGIAAGNELGYTGAIFVMWAHGLITGLLFFLVGMTYERLHTRDMEKIKALAITVPELGWAFVFAAIASMGMPGMAGFVGEFLSVAGSFKTFGFYALLVGVGVVLNTTYLLKLLRNSVFSPGTSPKGEPGVLVPYERVVFWVLAIAIVFTGIYPESVIYWIRPLISSVVKL